VDTGSAGSIFDTDQLEAVGIRPSPEDLVQKIRGVGGNELVFTRRIDRLTVGDHEVNNFEIEVGRMNYGFGIDGILGMDFLLEAQAVIDLKQLELL
jgi:hypothetical protein